MRLLVSCCALALLAGAGETEVFHENFAAYTAGEQPSSIVEVRRAPHDYAEVLDGAYRIHHPLNAHCPVTPPLADFTLTFRARVPWSAPVAVVFVDFRLDVARQEGFRLYYRWGEPDFFRRALADPRWHRFYPYMAKTTRVALLDYGQRQYLEPILTRPFTEFGSPAGGNPVLAETDARALHDMTVTDAWQDFRLEVRGDSARFFHNGVQQATFALPPGNRPATGAIGFDTLGLRVPGTLAIDDVRITSPDPLPSATPVLSRTVPVAPDVPLTVVVSRLPETWLRQIWTAPPGGAMYRVEATLAFPEIGSDGPDMAVANP